MRTNLGSSGIDLPTEETCELYAAESITMADHVLISCEAPGAGLRDTLIEALLLRQCWKRDQDLRSRITAVQKPEVSILALDAVAVSQRRSATSYGIDASDGHRYSVTLPPSGPNTLTATELLCLEFARCIGLPVPNRALIRLGCRLAFNAGITRNYRSSQLGRRPDQNATLDCLGLREIEPIASEIETSPLSHKTSPWMAGRLTLDLLFLNTLPDQPCWRNVSGKVEPVFQHFDHELLDGDWRNFLRTTPRFRPIDSPIAARITSYQVLERWIQRVEAVDLNALAELLIKQAPSWYGNEPRLMLRVIEKIEERRRDLRGIVHRLSKTGFFPRIRISADREGTQIAKDCER